MIKLKPILEATISFRNDTTRKKEIGIGAHFISLGRQRVGVFHIKDIGRIPFDPMNKIGQKAKGPALPNTIFMFGGMAIMLSRQGIGRKVIERIFRDRPDIEHITLYTTDQAIGFWEKLGGVVLGERAGTYYVRVDRP